MANNNLPGHGRLTTWFTNDGLILIKAKYGNLIFLDPKERIDHELLIEGSFDDEVTAFLIEELKGNDIFWDIGANIGHHALAVEKLHPGTSIYAFEPNPKALKRLNKNLNANASAIQVVPKALSNKEEKGSMFTTPGNLGRTSLKKLDKAKEIESEIEVTRADALISSGLPLPNVIKLDVEGNEIEVLQGFGELLSNPTIRTVVYEVVDPKDSPEGLLKNQGFKIQVLDARGNFIATRKA